MDEIIWGESMVGKEKKAEERPHTLPRPAIWRPWGRRRPSRLGEAAALSEETKEENVSVRQWVTEPNAAERPRRRRTQYLTFGDRTVGPGVFGRAMAEER